MTQANTLEENIMCYVNEREFWSWKSLEFTEPCPLPLPTTFSLWAETLRPWSWLVCGYPWQWKHELRPCLNPSQSSLFRTHLSVIRYMLSEKLANSAWFRIFDLLFLLFYKPLSRGSGFSCLYSLSFPVFRCVLHLYQILYSTKVSKI